MILYPAIDLKDGQCVRLLRGEMDAATVFNDDPAAQARAFQAAGCEWVHLVDLNGAFAGAPVNGAAVEAILRSMVPRSRRSWGRSQSRPNLAAASATWPPSRGG
jgi:phosphoribosylformimino-5-aminoimidazole carboxamide ribotide isomerase